MTRVEIIERLKKYRTWAAVNPDYGAGIEPEDCPELAEVLDAAIVALRDDEPGVGPAGTEGAWEYYTIEMRPRWKCSCCGKVVRRNPHDKLYCSACGARLRMEA